MIEFLTAYPIFVDLESSLQRRLRIDFSALENDMLMISLNMNTFNEMSTNIIRALYQSKRKGETKIRIFSMAPNC